MKVHYNSTLAKVLLPRRFIAIALGDRVFTKAQSLSVATLRHEQVHVEQWRRHGLIVFAARYLWYHVRYGYEENPFEIEARAAERLPPGEPPGT